MGGRPHSRYLSFIEVFPPLFRAACVSRCTLESKPASINTKFIVRPMGTETLFL
jgi:hypothetical protein